MSMVQIMDDLDHPNCTMNITQQDISQGIQALDLSGKPLCVHSSLCSMGWVDGGARAVIDGILAEGCTLMVPSFSWVYAVQPPPDMRPERNAWDYDFEEERPGASIVYSPDSMEIDRWEMGAVPEAVVESPGRMRGNHPLCSFSAVGPLTERLVSGQRADDVYAPLKALCELDGYVLLIGVGLVKMTLIHLAEKLAGRHLFRRWANGPDGRPMMVEVGGCSVGFENLEPSLAPLTRRTTVGTSIWQAYPAKEALELTAKLISENPMITHCGDPDCGRCDDAAEGGPIV